VSQAVKRSARKVQELLAGKITAEQLFSDNQHRHSKFESPFLLALKNGLTMESAIRDPCSRRGPWRPESGWNSAWRISGNMKISF
jgi:hypothetical protein